MDLQTWNTCTGLRARTAAAALGVVAAATLLGGRPLHAQTCGATMEPTLDPTNVIFAVGQSLRVNLSFGPTAAAGGFRSISEVSVRLDCENASGCNIGTPCVDDGNVLSYNGDGSILSDCPGVIVTSNNPGGGFMNDIVFTFSPVLVLPANVQCNLSFGVTIESLSTDTSPKIINGIGFFTGICAADGLTASACGTYAIEVVQPDIEIVKSACPRIVCTDGEPVSYLYEVTTGGGNAPLVGPAVEEHPGSLPAQSLDGTWHRAIVVTDDTCGPGGLPNTPLILSGDLNGNGLLDPGEDWAPDGDTNNNAVLDPNEVWTYTCDTVLATTTTNIATASGEYVNALGSSEVSATDSATVNTVTIISTPGVCETTYCAETDACTGKTCVWSGPDFTSTQCCITLGSSNLPGLYCVTVSCPGTDDPCFKGSQPISGTCCITFTPPEHPVVDVTGDRICEGDPLPVICATVTGGRPPYTVEWFADSPVEGCSATGDVLFTEFNIGDGGMSCFTPSTPGSYIAIATDINGCDGADCGSIISHPSRVVNAENVKVCADELPAQLCATASGGTGPDYTITWFAPDGVTQLGQCIGWSVGDAPCCISTSTAGVYIVRVVDSANCEDEDTATLDVNPNPSCTIDPPMSCNPQQVLTATAIGECDGEFTFAWTKNGLPIAGGTNGVLQATGLGQYCAVVTCSASQCTSLEPCCANVSEAPPCTFFCIDDACVGDEETFCGPDGFTSYQWSLIGACEVVGALSEQCVTVTFPAPGECDVHLRVFNADGCNSECVEDINVFPNRVCEIVGPPKGCLDDSKLYCGPPDMSAYTWMTAGQCQVDGGNTSQCVVITFTGNGNCTVQLHVNGPGGCADTCTKIVEVCPCPVCVEIPPPVEDPVCGSSGNTLTADVINLPPGAEMDWDVIYGPCLITDGENEVTVTYTIGSDEETEVSCGFKFEVSNPQSCGEPSKCLVEVTCMPVPCGEGCLVAFWKNSVHAGQWPLPFIPSESCGTPTLFCSEFNCSTGAANTNFGGKTLLQVLQQSGGGLKALGRQAVAALINATSPDVEYAISADHVKQIVNNAIASKDGLIINSAKIYLASLNAQGCPISGQSFCVDLNLDGAVGHPDLQMLLDNWGQPGVGDLDQNGIVGPADLTILIGNWGSY
jgi:hypothetical protein